MNTYNQNTHLPYVYICTHKETGHFYIGYREKNKLPSYQDLPKYKTSSTKVKQFFDQYSWEIIAEFFDGSDAYNFEQLKIYENWENPLLINKSCFHGKRQFRGSSGMKNKSHTDQSKTKMSNAKQGNTNRVGKLHTDFVKTKISESHKQKTLSTEHKQNISRSKIGTKMNQDLKLLLSQNKQINRVCRLRDRKEMDIANFHRYP